MSIYQNLIKYRVKEVTQNITIDIYYSYFEENLFQIQVTSINLLPVVSKTNFYSINHLVFRKNVGYVL